MLVQIRCPCLTTVLSPTVMIEQTQNKGRKNHFWNACSKTHKFILKWSSRYASVNSSSAQPPPPGQPPGISIVFFNGKFSGVGINKSVKCPGLGPKKKANAPPPGSSRKQHCSTRKFHSSLRPLRLVSISSLWLLQSLAKRSAIVVITWVPHFSDRSAHIISQRSWRVVSIWLQRLRSQRS